MSNYKATIGIECHVQLKTKTKLFAAVGNDAREAPPNSLISHICLGMPGALPVLNKGAVELAVKAAHALKTHAQNHSVFDRKHYFYPDLPKGYQITQLYYPIILGGQVDIVVDGEEKTINITRAHLEEDAGKSTHPAGKDYSLVDLNRAGTPLLEIVSEPEIHSAQEAKAYARELYLLMKYSGVSEADLYYGNMRFDVNVSVSATDKLGKRTETKNLNSFRAVEKAVEYEIARQIEVCEKGGEVVQETRGWDDAKQRTFSQRSKEEAHDYRYFPDPDIPPVQLSDEYIQEVEQTMGPSVDTMRLTLRENGLDEELTETILDNAEIATACFDYLAQFGQEKKSSAVLLWLGQLAPKIANDNQKSQAELHYSLASFHELAEMVDANLLSSTQAKKVFEAILLDDVTPKTYAEEHDLLQVSDSGELETVVKRVIDANPKAAEDIRAGEMKAIGFLVGQVMKESAGKANPGVVQQIIRDTLK